jgi:GTPase SAR1 family protein
MDPLYDDQTIGAVQTARNEIRALFEHNMLPSKKEVVRWEEAVNTKLLPRLLPDYPLVAAICGGGSSGKSTLFNALVGEMASPVGGRAGINRRLLVSARASYRHRPEITDALFDIFGTTPEEMISPDQLTESGPPLFHFSTALPMGLALVDTPDFDTGAKGVYRNREMAELSLRVADILIYIFTNANYNNRDNTDFIARMLTAVGTRDCLLVYRAYPSFSTEEILEHAGTVARNLYGEKAKKHVLGVFRAAEDNRVAEGVRPVDIRPLESGQAGFVETLTGLDPRKIREDLHRSVFSDVIEKGDLFFRSADVSNRHLQVYLDLLRKFQLQCVQKALGHLPMDEVVRRFSEIWQETDPSHVKIMRRTGKVVETPIRLAVRAAKWIRRTSSDNEDASDINRTAAVMEADFIRAANHLRQAALSADIEISVPADDPDIASLRSAVDNLAGVVSAARRRPDADFVSYQIPIHPCLETTQENLRSKNWSSVVDGLMIRKESVFGLTGPLEEELQRLVWDQRSKMTTLDQVRQTAAAMLNIIPATAAVTYVLSTGDPVGATGIKVQLAGLFGLNDLYALVAIPATTGMKKADLKQLETLLTPVAQAWLTHKLKAIESLFEETITGPLFQKGASVMEDAGRRLSSLEKELKVCNRALEKEG